MVKNLFGEGAGIFWGCACNEEYITVFPGPETENFLLQNKRKQKQKQAAKRRTMVQGLPQTQCRPGVT